MRLFLLLVSLVLAVPSRAVADEALWQLMRGGGQVILMRHAVTTPGVGDPTGFKLDDCSTQRNLTDAGREDARRVGAHVQGARHSGRPRALEPVVSLSRDRSARVRRR